MSAYYDGDHCTEDDSEGMDEGYNGNENDYGEESVLIDDEYDEYDEYDEDDEDDEELYDEEYELTDAEDDEELCDEEDDLVGMGEHVM